jgi:hypothetical protein
MRYSIKVDQTVMQFRLELAFNPALDTEVLPLFSQVIKDNYIANISYPLQDFVQKVCQSYPEYFQKNL